MMGISMLVTVIRKRRMRAFQRCQECRDWVSLWGDGRFRVRRSDGQILISGLVTVNPEFSDGGISNGTGLIFFLAIEKVSKF